MAKTRPITVSLEPGTVQRLRWLLRAVSRQDGAPADLCILAGQWAKRVRDLMDSRDLLTVARVLQDAGEEPSIPFLLRRQVRHWARRLTRP